MVQINSDNKKVTKKINYERFAIFIKKIKINFPMLLLNIYEDFY